MTFASAILALSPLAYYKLAEGSGTTLVDSSGNGRNGTYTGTPVLGSTALVDGDTSALLDGASSASVTDAAWMDVNNATLVAVFATVNGDNQYLGGRWNSTTATQQMFMDINGGTIRVYAMRTTNSSVIASVSATPYLDGKRHVIVGTYNGSNVIIWIDGVQVATAAGSGTLQLVNETLRIGRRNDVTTTQFVGNVSHFAFIGAAVTQTDVDAIQAGFISYTPSEQTWVQKVATSVPSVWWRLGEASGTTIVDASPNARDGTYANSPTLAVAGAITGDSDTAVTFNGTTQEGTIAFAAWMTSTSATYEGWVKGTGTSQVIFGRTTSTPLGYIGIDATGKAFFNSKRASGSTVNATGTTTVNDGNWHHVVGVSDGTNLRIYVDGVLEATNAIGSGLATDVTNGMAVGSRGGSAFLAGSVDEVSFYPWAMAPAAILSRYFIGRRPTSVRRTHAMSNLGTGSTGNITVTLPIFGVGDRMLIYVSGKPDNAAIPTINQGWTLLGSGTGGTGTAGVDVGQTFWAVFGKDAASASEIAPTLTFGSPAINVAITNVMVYRPAYGRTWADSITTSATYVQAASDTTTGSTVLTGTPSAFPTAPITGDGIAFFGTAPTDSVVLASTTITATGLSGGVVSTGANSTSSGNDMGDFKSDWLDFTGTASSGVTITYTLSAGTNTSGPLVAIHLRESSNSGSASLDLSAAGAAQVAGVATASLSLSGAGVSASVASASASLSLSAVGSWTTSGSASVSLNGSSDGAGLASGSAALTVSGVGDGVGSANGSANLAVSGSGAPGANGAGSASLDLTGDLNVTSAQPATGTAALTLSGSGVHSSGATAALDLSGSGIHSSVAIGALDLSASGSGRASGVATAALDLAGTGIAGVARSGTSSLSLSATGAALAATARTGTASLSFSATGVSPQYRTATGSLTFSSTGGAGVGRTGTASLTFGSTGRAGVARTGTASISLSGVGVFVSRSGTAALSVRMLDTSIVAGLVVIEGVGQITIESEAIDMPSEMRLTVMDTVIDRAPTSITVLLAGAVPQVDVTFTIDGNVVYVVSADSDGMLGPTSLTLNTTLGTVGVHTVAATQGSLTTSGTFTVLRPPASYPSVSGFDGSPVEVPGALTTENGIAVRHWVFQDLLAEIEGGIGSYVFPHNPRSMTSPHFEHALTVRHSTASDGKNHIFQAGNLPKEWQFTGYCPSQEHQEAILRYRHLNRRFYIIDHRNRAWKVVITDAQFVPRLRQTYNGEVTDWGSDFTISATVLDQDYEVPT